MTKETLHLGEEKGEGKTKTKSPETLPVRKERSEVGYCHILKPAIILSFFQSHREACRILVPPPGIEPVSPAVEAWSLNHWTAVEVPGCCHILEIALRKSEKLGKQHLFLILTHPTNFSISVQPPVTQFSTTVNQL